MTSIYPIPSLLRLMPPLTLRLFWVLEKTKLLFFVAMIIISDLHLLLCVVLGCCTVSSPCRCRGGSLHSESLHAGCDRHPPPPPPPRFCRTPACLTLLTPAPRTLIRLLPSKQICLTCRQFVGVVLANHFNEVFCFLFRGVLPCVTSETPADQSAKQCTDQSLKSTKQSMLQHK